MRRQLRPSPAGRPGFTLVELLVAAALCVVIMAILATAFSTGMDTLSQLKTVVGLSEELRSTEAVMRRDFQAPHLEDPNGAAVRVSDPQLVNQQWTQANGKKGYFFAIQLSQPQPAGTGYVSEGTDGVAPSFRAVDHALGMTVQLPGGSSQEAFSAAIAADARFDALRKQSLQDLDPTGGQMFVSRWAEVVYFLRPNGLMTVSDNSAAPPLNVYTLYRRQRALSPAPVSVYFQANKQAPAANQLNSLLREQYPDLSLQTVPRGAPTPVAAQVNTPDSVTNPQNRFGFIVDWQNGGNWDSSSTTPAPPAPAPLAKFTPVPAGYYETQANAANPANRFANTASPAYGTDVLLNNVVSMQVQVLSDNNTVFTDLPAPAAPPLWPRFYDTAAGGANRIKAIQIKIRAYDNKNKMTRQLTITQDL